MKYIVEAQALITIEIEAENEQQAYEKVSVELDDLEGIDWQYSIWKKAGK